MPTPLSWVLVVALAQQPAQLPKPTFETGVNLILVDVHVVDKNGHPILDLTPEDFDVRIDGDTRNVETLQLVQHDRTTAVSAASRGEPDAQRGPDTASARRMFVIAVDEHSLHAGNALAAVAAAEKFIDKLRPEDLVGLYAYPTGAARHDLTNDHASVKRDLRTITGLFEEPSAQFSLTPSEAIDIAGGDQEAMLRVFRRECATGGTGCSRGAIRTEAIGQATMMETKISQSIGGLRGLVRGLSAVPGRKVLVLVSGGLISTDRAGGRANASAEINALGREAALANISLFALHLDWSFITSQASRGGIRTSYFRDSNLAASGLERVAGTAGGAVMRVYGTAPEVAFDRILRETSATYLLGVESRESDQEGTHTIRVTVKRRGAEVRSRTQFAVPARR